jgi:hypothetical protein
VPVILLVVGLALAAFGVFRIVGGDSKVSELEDERDALRAEQTALVQDQESIERAASKADAALGKFIDSAETVQEEYEAAVTVNTLVIQTFNSGGTPNSSDVADVKSANEELGESVDDASAALSVASNTLSELEETTKSAPASAGGE